MSRLLRIDPALAIPIWSQIEEGMRRLVASGALRPGAAVPSVRDVARDLRVNPATVSKAYQRLTDQGVLEVRRGEGTFVASSPPALGRAERRHLLRDGALQYASLGLTLGAGREDALEELRAAWSDLARRGKGEE
jgi:DNA-binding transcriptional regulator YhcF (GntR family)